MIANNQEQVLTFYRANFDHIKDKYDPVPTDLNELNAEDRAFVCYPYTADSFSALQTLLLNLMKSQLEGTSAVKSTTISAAYDPSKPYIPRSMRPEWIPVGLMGKIYVRDDGTCIPGQKCSCYNGIATLGSSWFVLERISSNVVRILYK